MKRLGKDNQAGQISIIFVVGVAETKSVNETERLLDEYASLARRQYEVLQRSPYALLSRREAIAYDARFMRIQEISKEIIRLRSEASEIV
jgi:hypothetical protein